MRPRPGVLRQQEGIQRWTMSKSVEVVSLGVADHHRVAHLGTTDHPVEYSPRGTVWLRETCRRAIQAIFQGRTLYLNSRPPQVLVSVEFRDK